MFLVYQSHAVMWARLWEVGFLREVQHPLVDGKGNEQQENGIQRFLISKTSFHG